MATTLDFADRVVVPTFAPDLLIGNDYFGGTHFSRDGGKTTFPVRRGVRSHISDFACSPTHLYAGSVGDGVFVLRMLP